MSISVVVVDDEEVDRYLVKRRLGKDSDFGEVIEFQSGDIFIQEMFSDELNAPHIDSPILVLMDINMPGRDGFTIVEEAQRLISERKGPDSIVVMMFTSSNNEADKSRAETLDIVKGYLVKPLDTKSIQYIKDVYKKAKKT